MNGRVAKRQRREGLRVYKGVPDVLPVYESPSLAFDKKLYRERRDRGLSGTPLPVLVHELGLDEKGREVRIPVGNKARSGGSASKRSMRRFDWAKKRREARQEERSAQRSGVQRTNARGE